MHDLKNTSGFVHATKEKIWKRSFICKIKPTVHANPSRKRSFTKTLLKLEEFENVGFAFSVNRKHLENGAF